jgi:hypothetical protein
LKELFCDGNPFQKGVDRDNVPWVRRGNIPPGAYDTYDRLEREAKEGVSKAFLLVLSELEATPL